jgi:hypothetical protein
MELMAVPPVPLHLQMYLEVLGELVLVEMLILLVLLEVVVMDKQEV